MQRDIEPGSPSPRTDTRAGRSVIAVIGIDHYAEWPRLENAVSDARGASRIFKQLGFVDVTAPLLNEAATGDAIRRLVTDDLGQLSPHDSLVLFFAGHGYTHTASFSDVTVKTGCVIPVDATSPRGHVSASWLRLDNWLSDIARLPPRHILVIVDACHSGVALSSAHKWRGDVARPTTELGALWRRRSRRIIASALDDQRAMDNGPYPGHSLFTGCLIEALSGGLAEGGRHLATGSDIGQYLRKRVSSYPQSRQTPDFGAFELDDRGEIAVPILSTPNESGISIEPALDQVEHLPIAGFPVRRQATASAGDAPHRKTLGASLAAAAAKHRRTMWIVSSFIIVGCVVVLGLVMPQGPVQPNNAAQGAEMLNAPEERVIRVTPPAGMDAKQTRDWNKIVDEVERGHFEGARYRLREFEDKYGQTDETRELGSQLDALGHDLTFGPDASPGRNTGRKHHDD